MKKVTMKLIPPRIEEVPARCNPKIAKSTEAPLNPRRLLLKGG
jgi:hypothetical protein